MHAVQHIPTSTKELWEIFTNYRLQEIITLFGISRQNLMSITLPSAIQDFRPTTQTPSNIYSSGYWCLFNQEYKKITRQFPFLACIQPVKTFWEDFTKSWSFSRFSSCPFSQGSITKTLSHFMWTQTCPSLVLNYMILVSTMNGTSSASILNMEFFRLIIFVNNLGQPCAPHCPWITRNFHEDTHHNGFTLSPKLKIAS